MPSSQQLTLATLEGLLTPERLTVSGGLRVERVQLREFVDSIGDDALDVDLIIDKDIPDPPQTPDAIWRIKEVIFDVLRQEGESRYPYTSFRTPSEYAEKLQFRGIK